MNITIIMSSSSSPPLPSAAAIGTAPATQKKAAALSASFPRTVWGDGFLDKVDLSLQAKQKHPEYEVLREDVRKMVVMKYEAKSIGDDGAIIANKLRLIDAVQRLGVGYHFETEIEETLGKVHDRLGDDLFINIDYDKSTDLYHAALRFRLLRQQGFAVSPDGFRKLKNSEGRFKEWLATDEQGLLSLYEAAHIAFRGEDILDEVLSFATKTLKSSSILRNKMNPNNSFQKQIDFALRVPAWKCVPRSLARHSIDFYSDQDASHFNQKLLKFAKLDFNMVQSFHQQELHELSDWWRSIDVATNFPYVRDRLVEGYYCVNSIYFEPKYGMGRIISTKIFLVLTILDDTFDNFATYEEARALTEAIVERALQELPDRMKNVYRVILDLYDEIEREVRKIGPIFAVEYAKRELKKLSQSYLCEVRWRNEGRVPTLEEYMNNGYGSSGMPILCTSAFVGMGPEIATREAFEWATNEPKMMKATTVIIRLQNDIFSHKFEQKRNHAAWVVECYMKEYRESEEETVELLWKEISNAWKDVAQEYCRKPTPLPVAITDRVLNLARLINLFYENADGFTNSYLLKDHLTPLFIDPVPF